MPYLAQHLIDIFDENTVGFDFESIKYNALFYSVIPTLLVYMNVIIGYTSFLTYMIFLNAISFLDDFCLICGVNAVTSIENNVQQFTLENPENKDAFIAH